MFGRLRAYKLYSLIKVTSVSYGNSLCNLVLQAFSIQVKRLLRIDIEIFMNDRNRGGSLLSDKLSNN